MERLKKWASLILIWRERVFHLSMKRVGCINTSNTRILKNPPLNSIYGVGLVQSLPQWGGHAIFSGVIIHSSRTSTLFWLLSRPVAGNRLAPISPSTTSWRRHSYVISSGKNLRSNICVSFFLREKVKVNWITQL